MSGGYWQKKKQDDHCRNGCGVRLKWDKSQVSPSGKMIPLELETGQKHQCPNSAYNQKDKPLNPNYGNLYSGNELTDQKVSYKQSETAETEAKTKELIGAIADMHGINEEMLICMQELISIAKDIRGLILQKDNPNPTIAKASDMKQSTEIHSELGLSDPEDQNKESEFEP